MNYDVFTHVNGWLQQQVQGRAALLLLLWRELSFDQWVQRLRMQELVGQVLLSWEINRVDEVKHVEIVGAEFFLLESLMLLHVVLVDDECLLEAGVDQELDLALDEWVDRLEVFLLKYKPTLTFVRFLCTCPRALHFSSKKDLFHDIFFLFLKLSFVQFEIWQRNLSVRILWRTLVLTLITFTNIFVVAYDLGRKCCNFIVF